MQQLGTVVVQWELGKEERKEGVHEDAVIVWFLLWQEGCTKQ